MTGLEFVTYAAFIIATLVLFAPPAPIATPEPPAQPQPAIAAPIQPARVVVATDAQPDLATLPSTELRKRCQAAGVKWRNAHGKGKHLRKGEMIAALSR